MSNLNQIKQGTILSSFDDKLTLLQWLKNLEKAIKESNIKFLDYVKINEFGNKIQIEMSFDGLKVYSNAVSILAETDDAVTEGSALPVQSGAVYTSLKNAVDMIMEDISNINSILPLDNTPTANSTKGVTSGGVYSAIRQAGVGQKYAHHINVRDNANSNYEYSFMVITSDSTSYASQNLYTLMNKLHDNQYITINGYRKGYVGQTEVTDIIFNMRKITGQGLVQMEVDAVNNNIIYVTITENSGVTITEDYVEQL